MTTDPSSDFYCYPFASYRRTDEVYNRFVTSLPNVKAMWRITHAADMIPMMGNVDGSFNYLGKLGILRLYYSNIIIPIFQLRY